jgi:hypothetical protein
MFYLKELHPSFRVLIALLALALLAFEASAQQPAGQETRQPEPQARIAAPLPGEALQGLVEISGTTALEDFAAAEIAFAYQDDPTGTWFLILQTDQPVLEGLLARWDTSTITDGIYRLRLQVFLWDGQVLESVVEGLRVRNYTPVETSTPAPLPTGQPTLTLTPTPLMDFAVTVPAMTPLPTNPAQLSGRHFAASALRGVLVVFGALAAGALYLGFRWLFRH